METNKISLKGKINARNKQVVIFADEGTSS
jgi:hypothetical protein